MLFRTLIPFLLALPLAFAHRIEIEAGEKECFYETLGPQDKVSSLRYYNCIRQDCKAMNGAYM